MGPYGRQSVIYRDVFETVKLSDDSAGIPLYTKHFSTLEAQIAWKSEGRQRPLYVFYLARLNSVQKEPVPLVDWRPSAYLRQYAHEMESYWAVHPQLVLCAYAAAEWTLGNYATDLDLETFKPRDQRGMPLAWGPIGIWDRSLLFTSGIVGTVFTTAVLRRINSVEPKVGLN